MNKRECPGYRRTDDIDPQWLADYARENPGVYLFGNAENIDKLKKDLGSTEWQRMLSVWREHKQQQIKDEQLLATTLREFHDTCLDLNLIPHEVLQVLTAHLEANGGEMVAREIKAMRNVYSSVYGPGSSRQSVDQVSSVEKITDQVKE